MPRNKSKSKYRVTLDLTEKDIRDYASKQINLWTDYLLIVGILLGLILLLGIGSFFGEKPSDIQVIASFLLAFVPMVTGGIIATKARQGKVKDGQRIEERRFICSGFVRKAS